MLMLFVGASDFQNLFSLFVHVLLLLFRLLAISVILWSTAVKYPSENVTFLFGMAGHLITKIINPALRNNVSL